jgi:hypothetical protein
MVGCALETKVDISVGLSHFWLRTCAYDGHRIMSRNRDVMNPALAPGARLKTQVFGSSGRIGAVIAEPNLSRCRLACLNSESCRIGPILPTGSVQE